MIEDMQLAGLGQVEVDQLPEDFATEGATLFAEPGLAAIGARGAFAQVHAEVAQEGSGVG